MGGAGNPFGGGFRQGPFTYSYSTGGGNPFDGMDFSDPFDIFEQFFGGANPFSGQQARQRPTYALNISFMDAVKGATKKVSLNGKTQTIKIPAGVDDGSRIRFGDSEVIIQVSAHPKFKREDYDIIANEEISFPKAALGDELEVETIQGNVTIKIPAGTQPDTLVRLRGKGVKMLRGTGFGDHYVRVKIVVPKNLTGKQKEILKEFDNSPKKSGWF
jgi:DnaJ-class molecular chaperone